jgi:c-di-GMP phosphodiesterase
MFRDPSTQALYSLDREMAMQVIEGLFKDDALHKASIGHPNETVLAEKTRPLQQTSSRWLTDFILGQERSFTTPLVGSGPDREYYGDLSITLDTATYGQGFLTNAVVLLLSGVLRALLMSLVLYLVYHWLLTKPLSKMIQPPDQHQPRPPQRAFDPAAQGA